MVGLLAAKSQLLYVVKKGSNSPCFDGFFSNFNPLRKPFVVDMTIFVLRTRPTVQHYALSGFCRSCPYKTITLVGATVTPNRGSICRNIILEILSSPTAQQVSSFIATNQIIISR